jgi:hypothetical protein
MISKTTRKLVRLENPNLAKSLKRWEDRKQELAKEALKIHEKIKKIETASFDKRLEEFVLCCQEQEIENLDLIKFLASGKKLKSGSKWLIDLFKSNGFDVNYEREQHSDGDEYVGHSYWETYHNLQIENPTNKGSKKK